MKKQEIKRECYSCKNFIKHYTKNRHTYFIKEGCGECNIKKYTEEEREKLPFDMCCEKWEPCDPANIELKQLRSTLVDICASLKSIIYELTFL